MSVYHTVKEENAMTLPRQRSAPKTLASRMVKPPMMEGEEVGPGTPRMTAPSEAPLPKRRGRKGAKKKRSKLTTVYQGRDNFKDY